MIAGANLRHRRPFEVALAASLLMSLGLLSGCSVGPNYRRPDLAIPLQYKEQPATTGWKNAMPSDAMDRGQWWQIFQDPLLNELEEQVLINNQNLASYAAAYQQALAVTAEARSQELPTLSVQASQNTISPPDDVQSAVKKSSLGGHSAIAQLNWELDIWGKVRRQVESDKAGAQASAAELASVRLSAQAELATNYFQLRYEDSLQQLLTEMVAAYQRALDITQRQYAAGAAARSDVLAAESQLKATESQRLSVAIDRAKHEHALALLVGKAPADLTIPATGLSASIPNFPVTVPSALLERRPDIAQAERQMQQQNALIGVAEAAYFPDISLSGLFGYAGTAGLARASNELWATGASATGLLLDGGGRSAKVKAARASYDQSVAHYKQAVLTAFQNVEDSLSSLRILEQQDDASMSAVTSSRHSLDIAMREYQAGAAAYTSVVSAQGANLANEQNSLQVKANRLTETVALVKALGGGWNASDLVKPTN